MSTTVIIVIVVICVVILASILFTLNWKKPLIVQQGTEPGPRSADASLPLRLQAYERLVLLADRIALPHLISRMGVQDISAREMQMLMGQTIRQEFDHNVTQQIYVSNEAWEAIRNLKEQNLLIINQVASFLPETATATQLNKSLLDLLMEHPKASLHALVSEALSYEAKQLM